MICFTAIFLLVFFNISEILTRIRTDEVTDYYQQIAGFYEEPPDSLDAVYIGASHVYAFFEAPIAWQNYGITVFPFASGSQPLAAVPYLIQEIKKTQPQAIIILNINELTGPPSSIPIHYLTDHMPFSKNKIDMLCYLFDIGGGYDTNSNIEYFLPFVRFHSRWDNLQKRDFHYSIDGLKGAVSYNEFLNDVEDVSAFRNHTNSKERMSEYYAAALENILDFCDETEVEILFAVAPQYVDDQNRFAQYNSAKEYITARGYAVLDMGEYADEIGLDLRSDYYNGYHTNIHGALKITDYLSQYLLAHYDFPEKAGGYYKSWDEAYDHYKEIIAPYLTEEELSQLP